MHLAYSLKIPTTDKLPALPGVFRVFVILFWAGLMAMALVFGGHYFLAQHLEQARAQNTQKLSEFNQVMAAANQEALDMDRAEAATERLGLWIMRSPDPQKILHAALYESQLTGCKINQFSARMAEGQGQISFIINITGPQEAIVKARENIDLRLAKLNFKLVRSALEPSGSGGAIYTGIFLTI